MRSGSAATGREIDRYDPTPAEYNAIERLACRALNSLGQLGEPFRVYAATSFGQIPDYECRGISVSLPYGPNMAFLPFIYLRADMTAAEFRLFVRRQIPCYTHGGCWKATAEDKAKALALLDAMEAA